MVRNGLCALTRRLEALAVQDKGAELRLLVIGRYPVSAQGYITPPGFFH